jgi:hypothetical protein
VPSSHRTGYKAADTHTLLLTCKAGLVCSQHRYHPTARTGQDRGGLVIHSRGGLAHPVPLGAPCGSVSISITAFPVLARILNETNLLSTQLGSLSLSAAALNDVAAWYVHDHRSCTLDPRRLVG